MQLLYLRKIEYDTEEILTVAEILKGFSDERDVCPLPIQMESPAVEFDTAIAA
jgi:hypothetical protein